MPAGGSGNDQLAAVVQYWQQYCLPNAYSAVFDKELSPVGLGKDKEVEMVTRLFGTFDAESAVCPFLSVVGPEGCGKTMVIDEAIRRVFRRRQWNTPSAELNWWVACPNCQEPLYYCNEHHKVIVLQSPTSSAEAFSILASSLNQCRIQDEEEGVPIKRRDLDALRDYFSTYTRRLLIWVRGDIDREQMKEFLYAITDLVHNKDAVNRVAFVIEARANLHVDARIHSRLNLHTVQFRPFKTEHVATFVSRRLSYSAPDVVLRQAVVGAAGDAFVPRATLTYFLKRNKEIAAEVAAAERKGEDCAEYLEQDKAAAVAHQRPVYAVINMEEHMLKEGKKCVVVGASVVLKNGDRLFVQMTDGTLSTQPAAQPGAAKKAKTSYKVVRCTREVWPEYNEHIAGLWFTRDPQGEAIVGIGLATVARDAAAFMKETVSKETRRLAIVSWNLVVQALAESALFLHRLTCLGGFQGVGQSLANWLTLIGRPLTQDDPNVLQLAAAAVAAGKQEREAAKARAEEEEKEKERAKAKAKKAKADKGKKKGGNGLVGSLLDSDDSDDSDGGDHGAERDANGKREEVVATPEEVAQMFASHLAFHYHATSLYGFAAVPSHVNRHAIAIDYKAKPAVAAEFMEQVNEEVGRERCFIVPQEFNVLSNSQLMLLCLLLKHTGHVYLAEVERAKKSSDVFVSEYVAQELVKDQIGGVKAMDDMGLYTDPLSVEVVPRMVFDAYVATFSKMLGGGRVRQQEFNWPAIMESDLSSLYEAELVVSPSTVRQRSRTLSDTKLRVNVDTIRVVKYLRAQRAAASLAVRPDVLFTVLPLDKDYSLL